MATYTSNLGLFKYDTTSNTKIKFSIKNALNDNWDKIDEIITNRLIPSSDTTLGGSNASNNVVPSQLAVKTYVDNVTTDFIPYGTVIEGKFSELPTLCAGLANKFSNGTVTYKISQDETIDATVLAEMYGSVGIAVPQWNIPEVVIDGNEKTITVTSVNPYVPPVTIVPIDYNMQTGTLITNYNSKYQVIKIKNINLVLSGATYAHLYNSANIDLKLEACTITSTTSDNGAVVMFENGLCESYYSEYITTDTSHNTIGLVAGNIATVKSYSDTFKDLTFSGSAMDGGQVQFIKSIYDNIANGILCNNSGLGTLYTTSTVTGAKVVSNGTTLVGGITHN